MNQPANLDLTSLSFEQFLDFFFQHPEGEQFWYAEPQYALQDATISGTVLIGYLTRLFSDFESAVSKYSPAQISHGIWAMFSPSFSLLDVLWDSSVALEKRTACIRAMAPLFKIYAVSHEAEPLQKCFYMWWHMVVTGFWAQAGQFEAQDLSVLNSQSATLLESLFQTLTEILASEDARAQGYALHGLGHLHDPRVHDIVQSYLNENEHRFTEEHVQWIEQCRDGIVS
jgi:hypothetical protein